MDAKALLLQALDENKEHHVLFLQAFVRAASPNPPGKTVTAAAVITNFLRLKNVPYQVIDPQPHGGQPNIVADFQGGKGPGPRVVLNGHIDVFPVGDGSGWERNPWSGDISDGQIHGRGVVDMKSGTASLVIAYAYLYERREHLCGSVSLCAVSDEETGGKWGTKYLIQQDRSRWGGDVMLSTEPSGCGTVRFSEKGTLRMTCTVKTKGAHGAYLNLSHGAIRTSTNFISKVIEAVEAMPVDLPEELVAHAAKPEVTKAIDEAMGAGTAAIIFRPTVNVGTIQGGLKVNMIPDLCVFALDIRLPVGLTRNHVLALIESIIAEYKEAKIELSIHEAASNPFSFSSLSHPMIALLANNAKILAPEADRPQAIPSMGATDCKHYRYAGVPAFVYGCSPKTSMSMNNFVLSCSKLAKICHCLFQMET
jgi:succinyl-diaminopimelate desuccinylase